VDPKQDRAAMRLQFVLGTSAQLAIAAYRQNGVITAPETERQASWMVKLAGEIFDKAWPAQSPK
jgi:hypothetical protein